MQGAAEKNIPLKILAIFPNDWKFLNKILHAFHVHIYAKL